MGGTVSPLKTVSGTLASQSSASARFAAALSTASVEATVASDSSEQKMERIVAAAPERVGAWYGLCEACGDWQGRHTNNKQAGSRQEAGSEMPRSPQMYGP